MFSMLLISLVLVGSLLPSIVDSFEYRGMTTFSSGVGGLRVIGFQNSKTGDAVKVIGDYNNDGIQDFAVSVPSLTAGDRTGCGYVIIILGQSGSWTEIDIWSATSGMTTRVIYGGAAGDILGTSIGPAGDANGDGFDDVLIGAPGVNGNANNVGAIYVIFGMAVGTGYSSIDLATFTASASTGYIIYGPIGDGYLGNGVLNMRPFGDLNGDSIDDFAVSTPFMSVSNRTSAGAVWFIYGSTDTPVNLDLSNLGSAGVRLLGETSSDAFGASIDNVGDFNGDGKNDTIIGAYGYSGDSLTSRGAAYLIYGTGSLTSMDMSTFVTGQDGARFIGVEDGEDAGWSVAGGGDINDDGKADILIGAPRATKTGNDGINFGRVYAIFGRSAAFNEDFMLSTLTAGSTGFTIIGAAKSHYLGWTVSRGGDLDQDGVNDYVLGAYFGFGRAFVLYGAATEPTADIDLATYPGKVAGYVGGSGARLGCSISGGVDVTGDGIPDLLMGAYDINIDTPARTDAGAAFMVPGPIYPLSSSPTVDPTALPSADPSVDPSAAPSVHPSVTPSAPSVNPSAAPSADPSVSPSAAPSMHTSAAPSVDPSIASSATPSVDPSAAPSAVPSRAPSVNPSAAPSMAPSAGPSMDPSATPSVAPSVDTSATPSVGTSAAPSMDPSAAPSAAPSVYPSAVPSAAPSVVPSASPSVYPTVTPSGASSVDPSVAPSVAPSVDTSATPSVGTSMAPSVDPSVAPSVAPSVSPSAAPSAAPSVVPSASPSVSPSVIPSVAPSVDPSVSPSVAPSVAPSADPSLAPSAVPSVNPSAAPSATPTVLPSVAPSVSITALPTVDPTLAPTVGPSVDPTLQPTKSPTVGPTALPTVMPYQVVLGIQQDVYFINKADYDAQKAQCNLTIQHTVAASMDGVVPERVTDISVEEEGEEEERKGNLRALATVVTPVSLKYKVAVFDPVLSADVLTAQLKAKVQSGEMDNAFRSYAVTFNATKMQNGTFSEPQVSVLNDQGRFTDPPNSGEIAGLVLGGFIFLLLASAGVYIIIKCLKHSAEEETKECEVVF